MGSVVDDDYFERDYNAPLNYPPSKENHMILDDDNFVSLENEDFNKFKIHRDDTLKTNTSTKNSEEEKKKN